MAPPKASIRMLYRTARRPELAYYKNLPDSNVRTLSSHNAQTSGTISGFLYVPDLQLSDPCVAKLDSQIPSNVTRKADVPTKEPTLIALAPWVSKECMQSYLAAAKQDPARAFIVYQPDDGTSEPPPMNSPVWGMDDGGAWKSANPYPVYAVSGALGAQMMEELSIYSGNLVQVPDGRQVTQIPGVDPKDYIRVFTEITVSSSSNLPGLGLFLLIIVAVLISVLGVLSGIMHQLQRSRRNSLRRRVASGDVNLEALGIKRLTVPQEMIDKLPLYIYACEDDNSVSIATSIKQSQKPAGGTDDELRASEIPIANEATVHRVQDCRDSDISKLATSEHVRISRSGSIPEHRYLPHSQSMCAICLDDFESGVSRIRELPCGHIFHPECVDSFLANNSSLCPLCKKSVLPVGYCPEIITNAMVRRERTAQSVPSRVNIVDERANIEAESRQGSRVNFVHRVKRAIFGRSSGRSRDVQVLDTIQPSPRPVEIPHAVAIETPISSRESGPTDQALSRQQVAQARIAELTAGRPSILDPDLVAQHRTPRWRRMISRAFPGFS